MKKSIERKVVLNAKEIQITIQRLVHQLIENHRDFQNSALIALQPRGIFLAQRIKKLILENADLSEVKLGYLDATFFRDDFQRKDHFLEPKKTDIPFLVENLDVIFIDDTIYKGRSVRAALSALQSFGRPTRVELLALIDRRFSRNLPIQPDYTGRAIDTSDDEVVRISWLEKQGRDEVYIESH